MKTTTTLAILAMLPFAMCAQVGIYTTSPAPDSALDIVSTDKGILIPRVDIDDLTTIAPVATGSTESLLVYNTNISTGKGFYFWDGSGNWVPVGKGNFWSLKGDADTTPGTNAGENYLGTSDAQDLVIATNGTAALTVDTSGQLQASNGGSATAPTYSFASDTDTGIYSDTANTMSLAAGGESFVTLDQNATQNQLVLNPNGNDVDVVISSDNETNLLYTDASTDRVGIKTNSPQAALHIAGASSTLRIDALNSTNNPYNNGVDESPVFVDANGNIGLRPTKTLTVLAENNSTTFLNTASTLTSSGPRTEKVLYTTTFDLTQDAVVEIVYQLGVALYRSNGSTITDGSARVYRTFIRVTPPAGSSLTAQDVGISGNSYSNDSSSSAAKSGFFINASGICDLLGDATGSTYTVEIIGEVYGNALDTRVDYGGTGNELLQVIIKN